MVLRRLAESEAIGDAVQAAGWRQGNANLDHLQHSMGQEGDWGMGDRARRDVGRLTWNEVAFPHRRRDMERILGEISLRLENVGERSSFLPLQDT